MSVEQHPSVLLFLALDHPCLDGIGEQASSLDDGPRVSQGLESIHLTCKKAGVHGEWEYGGFKSRSWSSSH